MSLSVCMLTRNDEKSLGRALRSVAGVADQVVVADTGSTDRTVAVARESGGDVRSFAWDDDFGAARNFAIDQATGDWVLWLNPDEELLPTDPTVMRQSLARVNAFAYVLPVHDVLRAEEPERFSETMQVRLFRRHPRLRFRGRTQPRFVPDIETVARDEAMLVFSAPLTIRRHAYLSQLTEPKLRWAAGLLERELHDRPGQLPYLIEYGRTLLLLNDPKGHEVLAEAADQVLTAGEAKAAPAPEVQRLLEYLLTVSPEQSRSRVSKLQARNLVLRWFPSSPPLLWRLAEIDFAQNQFVAAVELLERLVHLGRTGAYDHSEGFDPSIIGEQALFNLGTCYTRLRELDKSADCFRSLLGSKALQAQAAQGLAVVDNLRRQSPAGSSSPQRRSN